MKVGRHEISEAELDFAIKQMQDGQTFRACAVMYWLNHIGVRPMASYRAADKLIQRERKAGNIHQIKHAVWQWKGETK